MQESSHLLEPLLDDPRAAALFLDYDGTLSPIVEDPARARPLPGVTAVLDRLGARFGRVVVVSGRPVTFLVEALGKLNGVSLFGLYGMEQIGPDGLTVVDSSAERWRAVVAGVSRLARREAPSGVVIEEKGLTTTLHWRACPRAASWCVTFASRIRATQGLAVQAGRMVVELKPPGGIDKGVVVERLARGYRAVAYFGDDLGDLPAFEAMDRIASTGVFVARVAVVDEESPPEVAAASDLSVRGPEGALELLEALARGDLPPATGPPTSM